MTYWNKASLWGNKECSSAWSVKIIANSIHYRSLIKVWVTFKRGRAVKLRRLLPRQLCPGLSISPGGDPHQMPGPPKVTLLGLGTADCVSLSHTCFYWNCTETWVKIRFVFSPLPQGRKAALLLFSSVSQYRVLLLEREKVHSRTEKLFFILNLCSQITEQQWIVL